MYIVQLRWSDEDRWIDATRRPWRTYALAECDLMSMTTNHDVRARYPHHTFYAETRIREIGHHDHHS